jgi:hypothetical protein
MVQPSCIYCRLSDGPFTSEAHVFPEGLIANRLVLPWATVCDPCNHYLGFELDSTLVAFPYFALAVQALGLPGKRGPRKRLANVTRDEDSGWLTVPVEVPRQRTLLDGSKETTVRPLIDKTFKMPKFIRALYHIAFNLLAYETNRSFVLRKHFDDVTGPEPSSSSCSAAAFGFPVEHGGPPYAVRRLTRACSRQTEGHEAPRGRQAPCVRCGT